MEQIFNIGEFIISSFAGIWPYLVITVPLAVFVNISGMSKYISGAMNKKPLVAIVLATAVGAFSPFCSCGVIPVIASLLIGGVPLAPVMSFWIASPSMDPEIFFLSTAAVGWKLSVWRLAATFIISLLSGIITHVFIGKGWLGEKILREEVSVTGGLPGKGIQNAAEGIKSWFKKERPTQHGEVRLAAYIRSGSSAAAGCCVPAGGLGLRPVVKPEAENDTTCNRDTCHAPVLSFRKKLTDETVKATVMVVKFMTLAFFINALIHYYVPRESISGLLGGEGFLSVAVASLIGIPFYTSSITALPLVGGLLELGMNEGAALAFLISGPVTTLPAMAAVWVLVRRKIFLLYVGFALLGAMVFGILMNVLG